MEEDGTPRALDRGDMDRLYRQYGGLVFRRARKILADEQLAKDVCQDVFVQLLRTGTTWELPSRIGWLYRTTTNCCLNLIRGSRRRQSFLRLLPPPSVVIPSLPTQLLLRGIPERLHEIAIFYGLDRMSQQEIALVLGLSQKTVSNRIRELRTWLADDETKAREKQK